MPRELIGGLVRCSNPVNDESLPIAKVTQAMLGRPVPLIEEVGRAGVLDSTAAVDAADSTCARQAPLEPPAPEVDLELIRDAGNLGRCFRDRRPDADAALVQP